MEEGKNQIRKKLPDKSGGSGVPQLSPVSSLCRHFAVLPNSQVYNFRGIFNSLVHGMRSVDSTSVISF